MSAAKAVPQEYIGARPQQCAGGAERRELAGHLAVIVPAGDAVEGGVCIQHSGCGFKVGKEVGRQLHVILQARHTHPCVDNTEGTRGRLSTIVGCNGIEG